MTQKHLLTVESGADRLDRYLASHLPQLSRSRLQTLIHDELVRVNGRPGKPALRLKAGDGVEVVVPPPVSVEMEAEAIPLEVVYQDAHLLVVDKPAGLTVHPGPGHPRHTLVNAIMALCTDLSGIGGELRPGIVHRLDKDTSGLMMVAKNDAAHQSLSHQLKEREVEKGYLALVVGTPRPHEGVIDAPVDRDPIHRQRMAVVPGGRAAVTRYRVREVLGGFSLLEVSPATGRTHQIRVHLASVGHPIVGDVVYSRRRVPFLDRQFLHACSLAFRHPTTGERLAFTSPLPQDLQAALREARALVAG
ncbi:MAG: RluA family pseudouridine synthase [Dehalococcoidia bacterium]|nr:RluA family pseudouridine synthase [Dehalococcoidia bacterium]